MLDVTVIILTKDEGVHIGRCLERLRGVGRRVVVVDSGSTDGTREIAREWGAEVVEHEWPGCQALQFNWALDNVGVGTEWVLRLDADEYLSDELKGELEGLLPGLGDDVGGVSLRLGRAFMGRRLRHGIVNGIEIVRLFRRGRGRYEPRVMDEHLVVEGRVVSSRYEFVDDSLLSIGDFIRKHEGYAGREASILLAQEYGLGEGEDVGGHGEAVERKRGQKARYGRLPLLWRAAGYFLYRYVVRLGFLDGKEGFLWDFMQGWWYRTLVDAKVMEARRVCGDDGERVREYVRRVFGCEI